MKQPNSGNHPPTRATSRSDDAAEFAARFKSSFRPLWLMAMGVVQDGAIAEDVVQEAAIIALKKMDRFQPGTNFTAWAGRIVRNVALNRARKERRRRTVTLNPEFLQSMVDHASADRSVAPVSPASIQQSESVGPIESDQVDQDEQVRAALGELSEVARACLLLRTIEEWDYGRIAEVLEIPEGTAMSHVHRTRKFLRDRLRTWEHRLREKGA
jgi:RNA polymerase sigma-70 factor, ECF subfamily